MPHASVTGLFAATRGWFGFGAGDVWSWFHSSAFDVSVWELFGALLHGGRRGGGAVAVSRSPGEFLGLLARQAVTVICQTPSAFYQLMEAEAQDSAAGRELAARWVVFGGEALDAGPAGRLAGPSPGRAGAGEHVRPHRDHGACHLPGAGCWFGPGGGGRQPGRPGDRGLAGVRAGRVAGPGAGRGGRGTVRGRGRAGPRLPGPGRADRGAVYRVPVRGGRGADVPDRGPGPVDAGRAAGVLRAGG